MLNRNILKQKINQLSRSEVEFTRLLFALPRCCDKKWISIKLGMSLSSVEKKISKLSQKEIITIGKHTFYSNGRYVTRNTYTFFCDHNHEIAIIFGGILRGFCMAKKPRSYGSNNAKVTGPKLRVPIYNITKDKSTKVEHSTICPTVSNIDSFLDTEIKKVTKELNVDDAIGRRIAINEWEYIQSNENIKNKRAYFRVSFRKESEKARSYFGDGGKYFFADERKAYIETKKSTIHAYERKIITKKSDYKLPYQIPTVEWDESWDILAKPF